MFYQKVAGTYCLPKYSLRKKKFSDPNISPIFLREISKSGARDLPWNMESITGFNIIEAESLDAAEKLAQSNPFIASIRIYELRSM
jgi:hypothetical protein